ncbi:restriction endonuclease subunit S [Vibrio cholerae]|uniref:restriction endonuclease subunit S n=1 Tax=Vibrio cholerae TaxID=666 RepID=UPI002FDC7A53|nr:restriction endonuclease subunit S [Vibrio cholerae]
MSQLPKGWVSVGLGNLADFIMGQAPKKADCNHNGVGTIFVKAGEFGKTHPVEIEWTTNPLKKAEKGDVLICVVGATSGKLNLAIDCAIGRSVAAIRPNVGLFQIYLYRYLQTQVQQLRKGSSGSAQGVISKDILGSIPIPLAPEAEQTRIVEKLDEVLAQVDTIKARLDGIPAILKRFRQSVLAAAVSGKLTEEWRGNAEYSDSKNQLVPSTWEVRAAKDICVKVQSGSTPRNDPFNQNGTIPFLKVYNIVNQKIDFDYKPQFITSDTHSETLKRSVAYPGDVLMNIVGPPLGKVAILTEQYPEWNLNQAITLFRANEEILLNKYLYFVLCEGELVRAVMPETKGSVGQVNISLSQCRDSLIPLPPLEEQKEIVRLVDQYFAFADTIEAQVKKAQARVDKLTQSILAKAFRGELVPQDPSDEPADKLLERIAAARKEAEALAKAAKKATNL